MVDLLALVFTGVAITNPAVYSITNTHEYTKNTDVLTLTATVSDPGNCTATGSLVVTADLRPLGGGQFDALTYGGGVWTRTFTNTTPNSVTHPDGLKNIVVTATDLLLNSNTGSDNITLDNTLPVAAKNLYAHPRGDRTNLTWTVGSDDNFFKYIVKYNRPTQYPTYGGVGSYNYPTETPISGTDALPWVGPVDVTDVLTTETTRDMFYFRVYTMDLAANFSTDASATERATNYYLGDFGSGSGAPPGNTGYDGYIDGFDLNWFGSIYWTMAPAGVAAEGDIGPTDGNNRTHQLPGHRYGIPHPDAQVEFEDLMIFSMNYDNVGPESSGTAERHDQQGLCAQSAAERDRQ